MMNPEFVLGIGIGLVIGFILAMLALAVWRFTADLDEAATK